jgi:hypothetical protein
MAVTSNQLTAGFRGAFYENGVKWIGAQGWTLERETTITEEGVLDQSVDVPVEQKHGYSVKVSELIVTSAFSKKVLDADRAGTQLRFLFIGDRIRNDGQKESLKMDGACISANFLLAGITRGSVTKRDISFKLDTVPDFASLVTD